MIELRTLGELTVVRNGERIRMAARKQYALLTFLAINQGRPLQREELTGLLWQRTVNHQAKHSLSQALYGVRQLLRDLPIEATTTEIRLAPGAIQVDSVLFQEAVDQQQYVAAETLYRGEFLHAFWLADAPAFEEWQENERARLGRIAKRVFKQLITALEERGDWREVERITCKLLACDPYDEVAHRARISAIAMLEGRAEALEEYGRLVAIFQRELGRDPEDATKNYIARIQASSIDTSAEPAIGDDLPTPMIGRADEFQMLKGEWRAVKAKGTRVVAINGEAGIGKTRICTYFLRYAVLQGARIFQGRCLSSDGQIPYSGIIDALLSSLTIADVSALNPAWSAVVSELLPEFKSEGTCKSEISLLDGEGARRRLFEGLARLIDSISEANGVVLFLDDFHWADDSTAALLHFLARRLVGRSVLILLAMRPDDASGNPQFSWLRQVGGSDVTVRRIDIRELVPAAVMQIVKTFEERHGLSLSDTLRNQICVQSGGRPFFILETMKAIHTKELPMGNAVEVLYLRERNPVLLPASIEEFLGEKFRRLSSRAMQVISILAVLGKRATLGIIKEMMEAHSATIMEALDELIHRNLVQERDGEISFVHDLIREAAYRQMSGVRRRVLHGTAAEVLRRKGGAQPGTLAVHHDIARNHDLALCFALEAADAARRIYAHGESEFYLRMALANATSDEDRMAVQDRLGTLLYEIRRYSEAERYLKDLEQYYDKTLEHRKLLRVRTSLMGIYTKRCAVPVDYIAKRLEEIVAVADAAGSVDYLAEALIRIVEVTHDAGQRAAILNAANRLLEIVQLAGDSPTSVKALRTASVVIGLYDGYALAITYSNEAVRLAERLSDPGALIAALSSRAAAQFQAGQLEAAEQDFEVALSLAEKTAAVSFIHSVLNDYGVLLMERGDHERAEQVFARTLSLALEAEATHDLIYVYGNLMLLYYEQGDIARARQQAEKVLDSRAIPAWWCTVAAWSILGLCALERGNFAEANQCRREVVLGFEGREFWVSDASYTEIFLARLAAMEGEEAAALDRLERAIEAYEGRDVFCRARLQLERARVLLGRDGEAAWREAGDVRSRAAAMGARPLVAKADRILERAAGPAGGAGGGFP